MPEPGINGADLDNWITGNYGDDADRGWECENCGNTDENLRSDEEPVLCEPCNEALEEDEPDEF